MFVISIDSACDLDATEMQKNGIECQVIPYFSMKNKNIASMDYRYLNTKFSRQIACDQVQNETLLSTHGITPFEYGKLDEIQSGKDVLQISLSSQMSGTFDNAVLYAKDAKRDIAVVDSKTCSVGINILVDKALKIVDNHNVFEAAKELEELSQKIETYFITTNTYYLNLSGRLEYQLKSHSNLKPCLVGKVENGTPKIVQIQKSQDLAIFSLVKLFSENVDQKDEHNVYISYSLNSAAANKLAQGLTLVAKKQAKITRLSPICTVVGGAEIVVLAFVKQEKK